MWIYFQVHFHNGMSNNDKDMELCMRVEGVSLPNTGFFGISAATGGLADDHDVNKLQVWSLSAPGAAGNQPTDDQVPPDDNKKFDAEFEEYQKKLKEQVRKTDDKMQNAKNCFPKNCDIAYALSAHVLALLAR